MGARAPKSAPYPGRDQALRSAPDPGKDPARRSAPDPGRDQAPKKVDQRPAPKAEASLRLVSNLTASKLTMSGHTASKVTRASCPRKDAANNFTPRCVKRAKRKSGE